MGHGQGDAWSYDRQNVVRSSKKQQSNRVVNHQSHEREGQADSDGFHAVLQQATERGHAEDAKHQHPPVRWPERITVQQIVDGGCVAEYAGSLPIKRSWSRFIAASRTCSHQDDLALEKGDGIALDLLWTLVRVNGADDLPQREPTVRMH